MRRLRKHALPVGLVEALETAQLSAAGVGENDRRNDLDVVGVRDFQIRIVEHRRGKIVPLDEERVARRVLADHHYIDFIAQRLRHRFDQRHRHVAGRTILLDEAQQRGPLAGK